VLPGGVADRGGDEFQAAAVKARDGVAKALITTPAMQAG
jgi:hypothetical protein